MCAVISALIPFLQLQGPFLYTQILCAFVYVFLTGDSLFVAGLRSTFMRIFSLLLRGWSPVGVQSTAWKFLSETTCYMSSGMLCTDTDALAVTRVILWPIQCCYDEFRGGSRILTAA